MRRHTKVDVVKPTDGLRSSCDVVIHVMPQLVGSDYPWEMFVDGEFLFTTGTSSLAGLCVDITSAIDFYYWKSEPA